MVQILKKKKFKKFGAVQIGQIWAKNTRKLVWLKRQVIAVEICGSVAGGGFFWSGEWWRVIMMVDHVGEMILFGGGRYWRERNGIDERIPA